MGKKESTNIEHIIRADEAIRNVNRANTLLKYGEINVETYMKMFNESGYTEIWIRAIDFVVNKRMEKEEQERLAKMSKIGRVIEAFGDWLAR